MARNKKPNRSGSAVKTPRRVSGRISRKIKPKQQQMGAISERKKKKMLMKAKELRKMKLLRERMKLDKRIQVNIKKSPLRKVILYPPIPPPPPPATVASPSTSVAPFRSRPSPRRKRNTKQPLKPSNSGDTIVIDSEDDCPTFQQQHPLFYVDTTGGFNDKEVPRYATSSDVKEPEVMVVEESILEDGDLRNVVECNATRAKTDGLNKRLNEEEIPILDDEDDGVEVDCEKSTVPMPMPKQIQDQSVIFCSEVIDLAREETRDDPKSLDFIPVWFDMEGVGNRWKTKRSTKRKLFKGLGKQKGQTATERAQQQETSDENVAKAGESSCMKKRFVIIDGNNVAFAHTHGQAFSVKGLNICIQYFKKMGHEVKAVVSQYRMKKEKSTDQKLMEEMYKNGDILLAPSKNLPGQKSSSYDDRLIISVAEKFDGVIISNDNFRDLLTENDSWKKIIETRVAGYTWVMDAFFLPDDPYGRKGPSLSEMLQVKQATTSDATPKEQ